MLEVLGSGEGCLNSPSCPAVGPCLSVCLVLVVVLVFSIVFFLCDILSVLIALVQDPTWGERGRLEKFVGDTYAPLLTKKAVKAGILAVFGIIFVSYMLPYMYFSRDHDSAVSFSCLRVVLRALLSGTMVLAIGMSSTLFLFNVNCGGQVVAGSLFFLFWQGWCWTR